MSLPSTAVPRRRGSSFQTRHVPSTCPVGDLVLAVAGLCFGQHTPRGQHGRHRVVDIDYAAPDFRMFEGERATQTPQDGMSRIGAIALRDRLGVAREDEQSRR